MVIMLLFDIIIIFIMILLLIIIIECFIGIREWVNVVGFGEELKI